MTKRNAELIRAEQAKQLLTGYPTTFAVSVAAGLAITAVQASVADRGALLLWISALLSVYLVRGAIAWVGRRRVHGRPSRLRWLGWYRFAVLLCGVTWGMGGLALFPGNSLPHQITLSIILAGVAAGEVIMLAPLWSASVLLVVPTLTPVMWQYAWPQTSSGIPMAPIWALFLVTLLAAGWRLSRTVSSNIALRLDLAESERDQRASEQLYELIFSQAPLGIVHFDAHATVVDCNDRLVAILGLPKPRLIGRNLRTGLGDYKLAMAVRKALTAGFGYYEDTYTAEVSNKDTPIRAFFSSLRDADNTITGGVGIVEDFTERKRAEALVRHQALYDVLTGLPNRRLLLDRLEHALARCRRHSHAGALLFLDLDYFKRINDSLGHAVGDEIIAAVSQRLSETLREEDTVARLSGDEFVILLPELGTRHEEAAAQAQGFIGRLKRVLEAPYEIHGFRLQISASIGLAVFPLPDATAHDILRYADSAMYRAKADGGGTARFYLPSMQREADQRLALESDLRRALESRALSLYFQPLVDREQRLIGAEALLRWFHPQRGEVPPTEFIPLCEQTGLILTVGEWVLREACLVIAELSSACSPAVPVRLSLNVSPAQFRQADFVSQVRQTLDAADVSGEWLTLELTEGVLIEDLDEAGAKIRALKALGIRFAVDDFGRGFSSLTYLKRLPVDILKVDQEFVRDITLNESDAAMVDTIITMARHLELTSVAEGVETAEQFDFLMDKGCEVFQGYYFSYPLSQSDFARYLRSPPNKTATAVP